MYSNKFSRSSCFWVSSNQNQVMRTLLFFATRNFQHLKTLYRVITQSEVACLTHASLSTYCLKRTNTFFWRQSSTSGRYNRNLELSLSPRLRYDSHFTTTNNTLCYCKSSRREWFHCMHSWRSETVTNWKFCHESRLNFKALHWRHLAACALPLCLFEHTTSSLCSCFLPPYYYYYYYYYYY